MAIWARTFACLVLSCFVGLMTGRITSLLDNDLYKFTMQHAARRRYPDARAAYQLFLRGKPVSFPERFARQLREEVTAMGGLTLTGEEREWLAKLDLFPDDYLDYLARYRFDSSEVTIESSADGTLDVIIAGSWVRTILWEVPLLSLISELWFATNSTDWDDDLDAYERRSFEKGRKLAENGCVFADFGTRRRRSFCIQESAVRAFSRLDAPAEGRGGCSGTSNVHLARQFGMKPVGTVAHEWIMAHGSMVGFRDANRAAFTAWHDIWGDKASIALTDTYTTDLFLDSFHGELAATYRGIRQDSGDPIAFVDKFLAFYASEGIDVRDRLFVFSDGLTVSKAAEIEKYVNGRCKTSYGIGTHLTNDFPESPSLDMVIKMTELNGRQVFKLTDDPVKSTGDAALVDAAWRELGR